MYFLRSFIACLIPLVLMLAVCNPPVCAQPELPENIIAQEQARVETIQRVSKAVVAIFPPSGQGGGSGVVISPDGLTLTNFHVVSGAGPFLKCGLNDGQVYDAVLIGIDPTGDVAMIKLLGREDFPFAPLGDSDLIQVGDWTFAMGNPFLLADDFQPTLTYGMVSGVQRYQYPAGTFLEYTDCIQVDTSINPGNSGGPLFNEQGEVVGINGRISVEKRGRVNAGAGYAISINQIKHFSDYLLSGRVVDHATLGATVKTDEFSTVIVDSILANSSAYFYGLRPGDEIISFGGRNIGSVNQFKNILGIYPKGWKVPLTFRRDGERYTIYPRLQGLHSKGDLLEFTNSPAPVPEEKPEENPEENPEEEPEETPEPTPPGLPHAHMKKPEIPEQYAHLYEERQGFANYHFNLMRQQELLEKISGMGDYGSGGQKWTLTGTISDSIPYQMVIAEFASLLSLPDDQRVYLLEMERPDTHFAGLNSEGLLISMYEFQQLLTHGVEGLTETYYVGSEPLDGIGETVDVLTSTHAGREIRWFLSRTSHHLVGWDVKLNAQHPECGIRIPAWKQGEGKLIPERFHLVMPDMPVQEFTIDSLIMESVNADES